MSDAGPANKLLCFNYRNYLADISLSVSRVDAYMLFWRWPESSSYFREWVFFVEELFKVKNSNSQVRVWVFLVWFFFFLFLWGFLVCGFLIFFNMGLVTFFS